MARLLAETQSSNPKTRMNSLEVLAELCQETGETFQKLRDVPTGVPGGPTLQALFDISKFLDKSFPFTSGHAVRHRKEILGRMNLLLEDGALFPPCSSAQR